MKLERGDILKFSDKGLDHLYKYDPEKRLGATLRRFRYRCQARKSPDCITVIRVGKGYHEQYHKSFLEKVERCTTIRKMIALITSRS